MSQLPESRETFLLPAPTVKRSPVQGVLNTIRFNWEYYLVALGGLGVGIMLAILPLPIWVNWLGLAGIAVAGYFLIASLLASLWIYDLAPLYRWEWLPAFLSSQPCRALNLHSGFDETSLVLRRLFPTTTWEVADFFDPSKHTEASIARARRTSPPPLPFARVASSDLPYSDHTFDSVFVLFAAHEIRNPREREELFQELRRVLCPDGKVVLVEHLRNGANLAVYGPGAMHFYSRQEWERLARAAGFCSVTIAYQTPFVAAFMIGL